MKALVQNPIGNILLIDDDESLIDLLRLNLRSEGYEVESILSSRPVDDDMLAFVNLVIIDSDKSTPDGNYLNLISHIKSSPRSQSIGLIYCSEFNNEHALVDALDAGADDCVRKPFSLRELVARIRAILRRRMANAPSTAHFLKFKSLILNTALKSASVNNQPLNLSNTEYSILLLLMKNSGKYLTRKEIFQAVWDKEKTSNDRVVDTNISRLRRKLGPVSAYLVNRPNSGYSLTD